MASRRLSATLLAGLLTVSLAACGSNDDAVGTVTPPSTSSSSSAAAPAGPRVLADLPDLSKGVSTTVTLDPQFVQGLTTLGLTPGVIGETQLTGGALVFPITGGKATLYEKGSADPFIVGVIEHEGQGITLSAGGKEVQLANFDVDAGESVIRTDITVDGAAFGSDVETFIADGSTLTYPPTMEGTNAVLEGTQVKLTAGAAEALNGVFGTTALTEGFPVGVAKIVVATQ